MDTLGAPLSRKYSGGFVCASRSARFGRSLIMSTVLAVPLPQPFPPLPLVSFFPPADATVDSLAKLDVSPIQKWVDDHSNFRFPSGGGVSLPDGSITPYQYLFGLIQIYDKSRPLGVPCVTRCVHFHERWNVVPVPN